MTAFADSFALIAWLNPRDSAHAAVAAYLEGFTGRLLTTEWVLMEFADALSAPEARATASTFLQAVAPTLCSRLWDMSQACIKAASTCSPIGSTKPGL